MTTATPRGAAEDGRARASIGTAIPDDGTGVAAGVATAARPLIEALTGPLPVRVRFWDGSCLGPADGPGMVHVRSADALRRILWAPGELGVGRAFVAGELDFDGDLFELIAAFRPARLRLHRPVGALASMVGSPSSVMRTAQRLGLLARPLPPPPEEARPRGGRHSRRRDAAVVGHHYDVGNEFYRLVLGGNMTYSCARFVAPDAGLDDAQAAKHELVCRKLGLHERPGMQLLDVGCGWGSMALHAASRHGARVVGITLSVEQAGLARARVRDAGLDALVEIRRSDYRELGGERFDAISSIGMFEHVGRRRMDVYFSAMRGLLAPRGRMLNHAISSVGGSRLARNTFVGRYIFPDGELIDVGDVILAMEAAGFEVRDVESLREHYARTLRHWVANLQRHWDEAVDLVGAGRARAWLLYMAGSTLGFEDGGLAVHQVLGVAPDDQGRSGMPATRRE